MPKAKPGVAIERLRECLSYDPDTGTIRWKKLSARRRKVGDVAGSIGVNGYIIIRLDGCGMLAHRVAWAITHGVWPMHEIDHVNRIRSDNRIVNLREATRVQNSRNSPVRTTNKLGVKGIQRKYNRFLAVICVDGVAKCIGRFDTIEEASACYQAACAKIERGLPPVSTSVDAEQTPYVKVVRPKAPRPTSTDLREWFEYMSDGTLRWKKSPSWRIPIGAKVGSPTSHGYLRTSFRGKYITIHQVVWVMHNGWPSDDSVITHINRDAMDNRIGNLQVVSRSEAKARGSPHSSNQFGARGVTQVKNRFQANIVHKGERFYLGAFATVAEAQAAYDAAYLKIYGRMYADHNTFHAPQ